MASQHLKCLCNPLCPTCGLNLELVKKDDIQFYTCSNETCGNKMVFEVPQIVLFWRTDIKQESLLAARKE